jgi:hypothetical protein
MRADHTAVKRSLAGKRKSEGSVWRKMFHLRFQSEDKADDGCCRSGLIGVLLTLALTGTTMKVTSQMAVVMPAGIAMSNSILIVDLAHHLLSEGKTLTRQSSNRARASAAKPDDFASHDDRAAPHGFEPRRGQRVLCPTGARARRRLISFCRIDGFSSSSGFYLDLREADRNQAQTAS